MSENTRKAKRTEIDMIASLDGDPISEAQYIIRRVKALRAKESAFLAMCSTDKVKELVGMTLGPQEF